MAINHNLILENIKKLPGYSDSICVGPLVNFLGLKPVVGISCSDVGWRILQGKLSPDARDEIIETAGYLVAYEDGYISWSPATTFEKAYKESGRLTYPMALYIAQTRSDLSISIRRKHWHPSHHVVQISGELIYNAIRSCFGHTDDTVDSTPKVLPTLFMDTGDTMYSWFANAEDYNAEDWCVIYNPDPNTDVGTT